MQTAQSRTPRYPSDYYCQSIVFIRASCREKADQANCRCCSKLVRRSNLKRQEQIYLRSEMTGDVRDVSAFFRCILCTLLMNYVSSCASCFRKSCKRFVCQLSSQLRLPLGVRQYFTTCTVPTFSRRTCPRGFSLLSRTAPSLSGQWVFVSY